MVGALARLLSVFWLYGTPIVAALSLLSHGYLLLALLVLCVFGWAWPATALALYMIDRGWFVRSDAHLGVGNIAGRSFVEGVYRLDVHSAPNGLVAFMHGEHVSGFCLPGYLFISDTVVPEDPTVPHESRHNADMLIWGSLWMPAYLAASVVHRKDGPNSKRNFFERRARRHAGQD